MKQNIHQVLKRMINLEFYLFKKIYNIGWETISLITSQTNGAGCKRTNKTVGISWQGKNRAKPIEFWSRAPRNSSLKTEESQV